MKIGERVRVINYPEAKHIGCMGSITKIRGGPYPIIVDLDGGPNGSLHEAAELEVVGLDPIADVAAELERAHATHPPFNSAHEGYAVILEELDELKEHVWTKQINRDVAGMRKEAVQAAAVCVKFIQMIDEGRGRQ
jgi:hypothetical protein